VSDVGAAPAATAPILVVDDDAATRALVAAILREAGIEALAAPDGESALRLLDEHEVATVLLDLSMPGMTGIELLGVLRGRADTRTIPVIVVTAFGGEEQIRALEAGATDLLTKPVDPDELVARVRAHGRARSAWLQLLEEHVLWRGEIANMLCRIRPGAGLEVTAQEVCQALGRLPDLVGCAVYAFLAPGVTVLLAGFGPAALGPAGRPLPAETATFLAERAGEWPRMERAGDVEAGRSRGAGAGSATIYASLGDAARPLGLLVLVEDPPAHDEPAGTPRQMLSAAFEFAAIVTSLMRPELENRARSQADSSRVEEIVRERAFRTVFQPVIDLRSGETVGHEALTRFQDGVAPDIWLAEAATVGRRTELDVAMLEAAVGAAARLPENTWLGTNVSPAAIEDQERLERALNRASRPVVLEVTEYERVDDYGALSEAVRRLRPEVRLAVDDAGAGYASLRHVLMLRPDFVKLDQEWIRGVEGDAARQALIGALVLFSERTASVLIAEGVETEAELDTLRALGVELGQGFFLGRPS